MIRLTSIQQALRLKDTIPELAIKRAIQFMGDGYDPEEHGHIIVIQDGDDLTQIKEIGEDGLFVDDIPNFEFIEAFVDGDQVTFELVCQLDDSKTQGAHPMRHNLPFLKTRIIKRQKDLLYLKMDFLPLVGKHLKDNQRGPLGE
jgi:hypothetical protein